MKNLDLSDYRYDEHFDYDDYDHHIFDNSNIMYVDSHDYEAVIERCIIPSIQHVSSYIFVLLSSCATCRLFWFACEHLLLNGEWLKHCISLVCGFTALYATIGQNVYILLFPTLFAYAIILLVVHLQCRNVGNIVGVIVIAVNITCELALATTETWNSARGIQMVIAMKAISLAFDVEVKEMKEKNSIEKSPTLISYLGYIFCPSSCTVGPWMPYNAYLQSMQKSEVRLSNGITWTVTNTLLALVTLCISNCCSPLFGTNRSWKWVRAYIDALTVRSSHYFISFLSQATLAASGISWDLNAVPNALMGSVVTKPWKIEFPHSLSTLVRNWNLPMHMWLKAYVFRKSYKRFNSYVIAVFATYITSSLLHGLYFQIYAVLLTLACFAYVENLLRNKLANIFDACITSVPCCKETCKYNYCSNRPKWWLSSSAWLVTISNLIFSLLSMFNLAYLGVMLSARDDGETSFSGGLGQWRQLDYLNHWIVIAIFIFYNLI